jgi:hypothetical protein
MEFGNFNAHIVDNFLTIEECSDILNFVKKNPEWERTEGSQGFWDNRTLSNEFIYYNLDKDMGKKLVDIRLKIAKEIEKFFDINKIYSDHLSVCRWYPDIPLTPHIDDMTDSDGEDAEWFRHREFGSVLYLNDDFDGGETYYPHHNKKIKPKAGMLVVHPGNESHRHGVEAAKGGIRYTLSSFWTQDEDYIDDWLKNEENLY